MPTRKRKASPKPKAKRKAAKGKPKAPSVNEIRFAELVGRLNLPPFVREFKFHATRRWKFDFAWPELMVAVEIEGSAWGGGRHTRGSGFIADCEKYTRAAANGWFVLRFTDHDLRTRIDYVASTTTEVVLDRSIWMEP